jgi:hypothetical protein
MEENESYKIYLRIGQKAGYFSIPLTLSLTQAQEGNKEG